MNPLNEHPLPADLEKILNALGYTGHIVARRVDGANCNDQDVGAVRDALARYNNQDRPNIDLTAYKAIKVQQAQAALRAALWYVKSTLDDGQIEVWANSAEHKELLLPLDVTYDDYAERMHDVCRVLSATYGHSLSVTYNRLLSLS